MVNELVKILVVDDEPDIREILNFNLTKEGYNVFSAVDGKDAVKKAKLIVPDLILLDIMLPEINGVEVCSILRKDSSLDKTLIAFLTARGEDFTEIAALEQGGDDFITKPIKPKVLMSRIKALMRRSSDDEQKNAIIEYENLRLDEDKFTVWKNDKTLDLPKKEFMILKLLLSKPGRVFNRDEIYQKIWGPDVMVGSRTIDVHIRKLREKIGEKKIKTVKGVGYKIK